MRDLVPMLDAWRASGQRTALCTVVAVHDRAPLPLGASLAVAGDGSVAGAISGGCVEAEVIEVAQQVLQGALPRRMRFAPGDALTGTGLPCGGGIDVWIQPWGAGPLAGEQERFAQQVRDGAAATWAFDVAPLAGAADAPQPTHGVASSGGSFSLVAEAARRLVLVGAGPLADALAALAPSIGMRAVLVDPRTAVIERMGAASAGVETIIAWPAEALARLAPLARTDAVLALSHQPAIDDAALLAALAGDVGFVGAVGSRAAHADRLKRLRERGVNAAALARIVGPVGLDLGGWAPGEVALSIAAEVVAARNGRAGAPLSTTTGPIHALRALDPPGDAGETSGGARAHDGSAPSDRLAGGLARGDGAVAAGAPDAATSAPAPSPITGIVLAAGAGRRFGGAKVAAEWEGQALVARAVRAAGGGLPPGSAVLVVVGAHEATVRAALPYDVPHRVIVAEHWAEGIGASLQAGLAEVRSSRALVLLADQPLVDAGLVARVVDEGCPAIADGAAAARPVVAGAPGHPVLLGPIALTRALDLAGDRGLAPLLEELHVHGVAVDGTAPTIDVDEPADLLRAPAPLPVARTRARAAKGRGPARTGDAARPLDPARVRRGATARGRRDRPWT